MMVKVQNNVRTDPITIFRHDQTDDLCNVTGISKIGNGYFFFLTMPIDSWCFVCRTIVCMGPDVIGAPEKSEKS